MSEKKWFSEENVELAKVSLSELPDLSRKRMTKSDVLEQLRDQIIELSHNKGYSREDIRNALSTAGIQASIKSIREILNNRKSAVKRTTTSRKKTTPEKNTGSETNGNQH